MSKLLPVRHAELVSASRMEAAERVEDWTLNRVQGDDRAATAAFDTADPP
jgi:hypothetical protein